MTDLLLVAIGANLPDREGRTPLETCRWAVAQLAAIPGLTIGAVSSWYCTAPVPASAQPDYINGVALACASFDPETLLSRLQAIEAAAGRERGARNAARVLDLDLLAMADRVVNSATLQLPHPRLAERAFVLFPLCDVAPGWRHPRLGRTALELREALPPQAIERLAAEESCPAASR